MLPLNEVTPSSVISPFLFPYDEYSDLSERVYGGINLNDASQGREVKLWSIGYDGLNITVTPEGGSVAATYPRTGVVTCSLGFDANMDPAIAWIDSIGAHLRYFDSYTLSYIVLDIPGATSCKARTDDTRAFNSTGSDVIFAYVLNSNLYYRAERDHYATQYLVGAVGPGKLVRMGMNDGYRFQFDIQ